MSDLYDILGWRPPIVLPPAWSVMRRVGDGVAWTTTGGLGVIVSVAKELDGRRWVHLSCSRRGRLPTWADLREVKSVVLGDVYAYQVLPPAAKYVNIHPSCLHLFHCLDADPMPDFTRGTGSL